MFSRRALHSPALRRQIGRGILSKPPNIISTFRPQLHPLQTQQRRSIKFQWPRDDRPTYEYDPEKHSRAEPLFTPRQRHYQRGGVLVAVLGTGGVIFYFSNIEEVPMTGRKRFNCFSPESAAEQGAILYRAIMQGEGRNILPEWDARVKQVERVLNRLVPVSGMSDGSWEVHVIDEPDTRNAFVIPGNKVFVYSGILPICKTDDGLAAVLGHEIAHNLAQHSAERMSQTVLLQVILWAIIAIDQTQFIGNVLGRMALDLGVSRPASRKQESEADYIGLMMMARACYDPKAAVGLWKRMKKAAEEEEGSIPQFMSTHPSNENRISRIQEWLPKAEAIQSETDCNVTAQYSNDFIRAWGREFVREP